MSTTERFYFPRAALPRPVHIDIRTSFLVFYYMTDETLTSREVEPGNTQSISSSRVKRKDSAESEIFSNASIISLKASSSIAFGSSCKSLPFFSLNHP